MFALHTKGAPSSSRERALSRQLFWFLSQEGFSIVAEAAVAVKFTVSSYKAVANVDFGVPADTRHTVAADRQHTSSMHDYP